MPIVATAPSPRITMEGQLSVWHDWGTTDGGGLGMLDLIAGFSQTYPNVKVENVATADTKKFSTAIASGLPPDTFKVNSPDLPSFTQQGAFTALDPYIGRDKWDMQQYFPFTRDQLSWNGKTMAISHHSDCNFMFMAQTVMQEVGLDPNQGPTSWDDLLGWGLKMSQKQGDQYTRFGFVPIWYSYTPWPTPYMQANGVQLLSDDGRKATFATQAAADAMTWVTRVVDEVCGGLDTINKFSTAYKSKIGGGGYGIFPTERIGMLNTGNYFWDPISRLSPTMQVKNTPFPGGPGAAGKWFIDGGGNGLTIPTGAKHPDLAWEFLKFLGSEDGGYLIQLRTSDVSGNVKAANDPRIVETHLGRKQVLPFFSQANELYYVKSPVSSQFDQAMTQMGTAILQKKLGVQDALAQANQMVQAELDKYWSTQK